MKDWQCALLATCPETKRSTENYLSREEKTRPAQDSQGIWAGSIRARSKEQILQRDKYIISTKMCSMPNASSVQIHPFKLFSRWAPYFLEQNSESSPWPTGIHDLVLSSIPSGPWNSSLPLLQPHWPSRWNVHHKAHSLTSFRSPFSSPETPSVPLYCLIFLQSAYHNPPHINLLWVSPQ